MVVRRHHIRSPVNSQRYRMSHRPNDLRLSVVTTLFSASPSLRASSDAEYSRQFHKGIFAFVVARWWASRFPPSSDIFRLFFFTASTFAFISIAAGIFSNIFIFNSISIHFRHKSSDMRILHGNAQSAVITLEAMNHSLTMPVRWDISGRSQIMAIGR